MDNPILSKTQDVLTPIWKQLCDGCHLNRDTLQLIKNAPFHILQVNSVYKGLFLAIKAQKKNWKPKKLWITLCFPQYSVNNFHFIHKNRNLLIKIMEEWTNFLSTCPPFLFPVFLYLFHGSPTLSYSLEDLESSNYFFMNNN